MSELPSEQELEEQLMKLIADYQEAQSYDDKIAALTSITELADGGYVGACYVVGSCMAGKGPCGDGFLEKNDDKARKYLNQAHELGDPVAKRLLEQSRLA